MSTKERIMLWIRAIRAPFFSATIMSAVIAGALAYSEGKFSWLYLFSAGKDYSLNTVFRHFYYWRLYSR